MSGAEVQSQGSPPADEIHMELTTVAILRMWLFTAVVPVAALVPVHQVKFIVLVYLHSSY